MDTIKVIPPGQPVLLSKGTIEGVVSGICLRAGPHIEYQVEYWDDCVCRCEWFDEHSVEAKNGERVAVGFGS